MQEGWMQTACKNSNLHRQLCTQEPLEISSRTTPGTAPGQSTHHWGKDRGISLLQILAFLYSHSKASLLNTTAPLTLTFSISMFCTVLDDCFIFTTYTPPNTVIRDPMWTPAAKGTAWHYTIIFSLVLLLSKGKIHTNPQNTQSLWWPTFNTAPENLSPREGAGGWGVG